MRKILKAVLLVCVFSTLTVSVETQAHNALAPAQSKQQFINDLVAHHHFNRQQLTQLIDALHVNHTIINTMTQPFETKPWTYYRNYFITPERITLGARYLKTHRALLQKMQSAYGIPASIIVAIIGIETEYGLHLGKYPVLDTLYTLAFYYPPRETFFRKEFGQYLMLSREDHLPMGTIKGSYAGALGIPQFMPSSYRYYGISASDSKRVNLFNNDDAIASVANYFHKMGWKPNQPIAHHLYSLHESVNQKYARRIMLPLGKRPDYWEVYRNFDVIMSYNHNVVYAMAVYQLSQKIAKQYQSI